MIQKRKLVTINTLKVSGIRTLTEIDGVPIFIVKDDKESSFLFLLLVLVLHLNNFETKSKQTRMSDVMNNGISFVF